MIWVLLLLCIIIIINAKSGWNASRWCHIYMKRDCMVERNARKFSKRILFNYTFKLIVSIII